MPDYGTGGLGSNPGLAHILHCFPFFLSIFILDYFILVIWNYKKNHCFTFYIELCTKPVGVGLNLALLKDK